MSETVRAINRFFKEAVRKEVDEVRISSLLSERQDKIFDMFYIKKLDINFIADTLNVCPQVINNELKAVRRKMIKIIDA